MAEERAQRRLAAILAADVVGYSRLMGSDEVGTLARLNSLRKELFYPSISEYGGRVVKTTGDGTLIEFPSAVDAVQHAVEVQTAIGPWHGDTPANQRIELRMGINVGDIIVEADDIYGDGVNVAARLEGLAEPGGICISGTVFDQVKGKLDLSFVDLGPQDVKNIIEPVRVYQWSTGKPTTVGETQPDAKPLAPGKPSIAVLPFQNMSGDPEQEYFSDGITEDIITALSRVRQFFVIARNTTFTYKSQAVDVQAVARDLGVRYVLEGSVRKAGNRVRITAQLIDGETSNHIWADKYDRDLEDIFAVQDEITQTVVGAIGPELSRAEQQRVRMKPPESLDAWDIYQRGLWHVWHFTKEDNEEAQRLFTQAIHLDPSFCAAHVHLAYAHYQSNSAGLTGEPEVSAHACLSAAQAAISCDNHDPLAHWALGGAWLMNYDAASAIDSLQHAIRLNPSLSWAHLWLGQALAFSGNPEEALPSVDTAMRLSPSDPLVWAMMLIKAAAYGIMEEFEEAERWVRRSSHQPNTGPQTKLFQLAILGHLGRSSEAKLIKEELQKNFPELLTTKVRMRHALIGGYQPVRDLVEQGLRKAGLPE